MIIRKIGGRVIFIIEVGDTATMITENVITESGSVTLVGGWYSVSIRHGIDEEDGYRYWVINGEGDDEINFSEVLDSVILSCKAL